MRTRRFGPPSEEISVLGLGTRNMERDERAQAIAALRRGIELGPPHIDAAEMYGDIATADRVTLDETSLAALETSSPPAPWRGLPMI